MSNHPTDPTATASDTVSSTSDDRTANNASRHAYRVLSDDEKAQMQDIKGKGAALIEAILELDHFGACVRPGFFDDTTLTDRNLELARQHAEDAVMRAVRHITR